MTVVPLGTYDSLLDRALLYRVFCMPAVAYSLRFVCPTVADSHRWNMTLMKALSRACGARRCMLGDAVACITGIEMPAAHEHMLKVSELFFAQNAPGGSSVTKLARDRFANHEWELLRSSRNRRAVVVTKQLLGWSVKIVVKKRQSRDDYLPDPLLRSSGDRDTAVINGNKRLFVSGSRSTWGYLLPPIDHRTPVVMYTDGSASVQLPQAITAAVPVAVAAGGTPAKVVEAPTSAWGVCVRDEWLEQQYSSMPSEHALVAKDVRGATIWHGRIDASDARGNYCAELIAIYYAMTSVAVWCALIIYSDAQSAIKAIESYMATSSSRKKLRMAGRPILALIAGVMTSKQQCCPVLHNDLGGTGMVQLRWVHAHSDGRTIEHVGNRLADWGAKAARKGTIVPTFDLDPSQGEEHIRYRDSKGYLITGDIRREASAELRRRAHARWLLSASQCYFAPVVVACRDTWQWVVANRPDVLVCYATSY